MSSIQELEDRKRHVQELRQNYELSIETFEQEFPPEQRTPQQQSRLEGMKADVADMYKEEEQLKAEIRAEYRREQRPETREYERENDRTR